MPDIKKQYGVIPFFKDGDSYRLILVTSRTNKYWIFPKGNVIKGKDKHASAEQEAFEEAGITGRIKKSKAYVIDFSQGGQTVRLTLFPMAVESIATKWPEMRERKRKIVSPKKAREMMCFDLLKKCLRKWEKDFL
ncbi:MAG: NUDIX hydrolase [Lentisphaeria bacterium]|nr:NUDIX hydrolase [Lentisphaeria bacterium]